MTAPSAWRPLSEAPHEGTIVVKRTSGRVQLATATVVTVGYDVGGGDRGWQEAAWVDERDRVIPDDSIAGWLPMVADTLELDRAVQKAVAEAFGELIGGILAASQKCANLAGRRVAADCQRLALARFASILHTSMGGRIPDEVPHG